VTVAEPGLAVSNADYFSAQLNQRAEFVAGQREALHDRLRGMIIATLARTQPWWGLIEINPILM
jgi:hypothetical protein